MSVTIYWIENGAEHRAEVDSAFIAAQVMYAVERNHFLTPAGWSWDTDEEYAEVIINRSGRGYTAEPEGQRQAGRPRPEAWAATRRRGGYFHALDRDRSDAYTMCGRSTASTVGWSGWPVQVQPEMTPCPRCYPKGSS